MVVSGGDRHEREGDSSAVTCIGQGQGRVA